MDCSMHCTYVNSCHLHSKAMGCFGEVSLLLPVIATSNLHEQMMAAELFLSSLLHCFHSGPVQPRLLSPYFSLLL